MYKGYWNIIELIVVGSV